MVLGDAIRVSGQPTSVAITLDGATALVCDQHTDMVSVLDVRTPNKVAVIGVPIHVGDGPQCVAITPDGTTALVCNTWDSTVSVLT